MRIVALGNRPEQVSNKTDQEQNKSHTHQNKCRKQPYFYECVHPNFSDKNGLKVGAGICIIPTCITCEPALEEALAILFLKSSLAFSTPGKTGRGTGTGIGGVSMSGFFVLIPSISPSSLSCGHSASLPACPDRRLFS
jgi:hypothetical protein